MRQSCKTCKYFYSDWYFSGDCTWKPKGNVPTAYKYGFETYTTEGSGRTCKCYVAKIDKEKK